MFHRLYHILSPLKEENKPGTSAVTHSYVIPK